jgi:hypothetical protein
LPADLQRLIAGMAAANRTWGEERIASEPLVKLGVRVSPRTVRRYMPAGGVPPTGVRSQTWSTFVRNHATAVLACDFFVVITATFRVFYVFVVLEVGYSTDPALEYACPSDGRLDGAAVPEWSCQATSAIDGSFTTATASILRASMPLWRPWV